MDYQHTGDIEDPETARLAWAGVTPAANDPSTRLLVTSIPTGGGEGGASQPLSANNNDEEPLTPLPPVPATILFIVTFLPVFIIFGSLWALGAFSKQDPLGFSLLALLLLFSLVPCGLGIAVLVRVCSPFQFPKWDG